MANESLHEDRSTLKPGTLDRHRAVASLMEELEAIDSYQQRADATVDPELRAILEHNRDEEMEHAAMIIEWLRRTWPMVAKQLGTYIGRAGPIVAVERAAASRPGNPGTPT